MCVMTQSRTDAASRGVRTVHLWLKLQIPVRECVRARERASLHVCVRVRVLEFFQISPPLYKISSSSSSSPSPWYKCCTAVPHPPTMRCLLALANPGTNGSTATYWPSCPYRLPLPPVLPRFSSASMLPVDSESMPGCVLSWDIAPMQPSQPRGTHV